MGYPAAEEEWEVSEGQWTTFWEIGKTPRDSFRSFVKVYLLEELGAITRFPLQSPY